MGIYWHGKKETPAVDLSKYLTCAKDWYISDEWAAVGEYIKREFEELEKSPLYQEWKRRR